MSRGRSRRLRIPSVLSTIVEEPVASGSQNQARRRKGHGARTFACCQLPRSVTALLWMTTLALLVPYLANLGVLVQQTSYNRQQQQQNGKRVLTTTSRASGEQEQGDDNTGHELIQPRYTGDKHENDPISSCSNAVPFPTTITYHDVVQRRRVALKKSALLEKEEREQTDPTSSKTTGDKPKILVVGLPKAGTTTVASFLASATKQPTCDFHCEFDGPFVREWKLKRANKTPVGVCMQDTLQTFEEVQQGISKEYNEANITSEAIATMQQLSHPSLMKHCGNYQVYGQLDYIRPALKACYFPQIMALQHLYEEDPYAIWVLNTRNISDWKHSLSNWPPYVHKRRRIATRILQCGESAGAPHVANRSILGENPKVEYDLEAMQPLLHNWYCQHLHRIRTFVRDHPTLTLLEIDIAAPETPELMARFFNVSDNYYWGHANPNSRLLKEKYANSSQNSPQTAAVS